MRKACFELWEDIPGFEGYYQVSNMGNVRSCDRMVNASFGSKQLKRGQYIKPIPMPNGYLVVTLHKENTNKSSYVHRLVAEAFVPNPNRYNEVNHIDEDKTNNSYDNLEWCDHYYNINYGNTRKKISEARKRKGYGCIPIVQIDAGGNVLASFKSASEAEEKTGISASSIRKVCLGRKKFRTAGGYIWRNI